MSSVSAPTLSAELLASLCRLPGSSIRAESRWSRLRHSRPARFGAAIIGVSLTVAFVAYSVGGVRETIGDGVTPAADIYTADFTSSSATPAATETKAVSTAGAVAPAILSQLNASGWPCHDTLAGDMHRVKAQWLEHGQVISLTYANTTHRLDLFEQNGVLDPDGLHGFDKRTISDAKVWVRDGIPTVVAWDYDGVVYTVVTDAGRDHIAKVLRQLPTPVPADNPAKRIGDGLDRMATWISPAA